MAAVTCAVRGCHCDWEHAAGCSGHCRLTLVLQVQGEQGRLSAWVVAAVCVPGLASAHVQGLLRLIGAAVKDKVGAPRLLWLSAALAMPAQMHAQ